MHLLNFHYTVPITHPLLLFFFFMTSYRVCLCFRREFKQHSTDAPPAVMELFDTYAEEGEVMEEEELQRFLREVQCHSEADGEVSAAASEVVEKYGRKPSRPRRGKAGLALDVIFRFLCSDGNLALKPSVHHDMTAPLSHYFIYTGHNSYLTGNQLSSECSDVPIVQALRRGVRVIELDMWPNSSKDDVDVLHGRTLTTPVKLTRCLTSIKEHAFSTSPYPVILTLEDHLTPPLQARVAEMVTKIFGDMLYIPKANFFNEFPSPAELKMKVIISTKPPKKNLQADVEDKSNIDIDPRQGENNDTSSAGKWGDEIPPLISEKSIQKGMELDQCEGSQDEDEIEDEEQNRTRNAAPEYKRLIAISVRKRCGVVDSFKLDPERAIRLSISEQLLEKAAASNGASIVRFTQQNLLRIFPKTTRIMSSNYNPILGWVHGAQMVAFNMQGYGRPLWLMHGLFRANGSCGYLKKPNILLNSKEHEIFNPAIDLPTKKTLKVTIYTGDGWRLDFHQTHFDTYSPPDFYTRIGIAGVPKDTIMKQTKIIKDNWMPVWEEEFLFPLTVPEIALLRIEVHEYDMTEKDDFAGQNCIPVSELRMGVRTVPLFDDKGEQLKFTRLLMRFEFL